MKQRKLYQSFVYASEGLLHVVKTQRHMQFHLLAGFGALVVSFLLKLPPVNFALIILSIACVWVAEMFNTAIEVAIDYASGGEVHPMVKRIKDVGAGAVLVASLNAVIVGGIVFIPHIHAHAYTAFSGLIATACIAYAGLHKHHERNIDGHR